MATEASTIAFTRAVHVVFGEWSALKLAVENEWGGNNTRDRALALLQRVLNGLLQTATVHRDEVEDLLDNALLDDFNVEAEDDSPSQVAVLLCQLHGEAKSGLTTTADQLLQRAATRGGSSWVEAPPPPRAHNDSSDDEDEGEESGDEGGASSRRGGGGGDTDMMDAEDGGRSRRPEPEVDEDGFQMVPSRRRR